MRQRNNKTSKQKSVIPIRKINSIVFAVLCAYVVVASVLTTTPIFAEREILSNLDCVVEPSEVVKLGSAVPGQLAHTSFDKTDFVSAGDVMARLESSVERASLALAEEVARHATAVELRRASAAFGERTRVRNAQLHKTSSISSQAMDQVNTETEIARLQVQQEVENKRLADLRVARERAALERRSIISPIHGTVVERFKSAGEYVDSEPVYEIAQLDPLHIEVIVPLEHLGKVEAGMLGEVTLFAPGFENTMLNAIVRRIDAVSDAASATYGVRLELDNPDMTIPSGVRCQVSVLAS